MIFQINATGFSNDNNFYQVETAADAEMVDRVQEDFAWRTDGFTRLWEESEFEKTFPGFKPEEFLPMTDFQLIY